MEGTNELDCDEDSGTACSTSSSILPKLPGKKEEKVKKIINGSCQGNTMKESICVLIYLMIA